MNRWEGVKLACQKLQSKILRVRNKISKSYVAKKKRPTLKAYALSNFAFFFLSMQQNVVSLPITNSECDSPNSVKNRGDFSALELRFSCLNSSKSALRFSFVNFQVKVYSDRAASDCCNKTKKKENTTCYMSVIWPVKRKLYFWLQNTAKSKATNPFSVSTGFVNSQMLGGGKKKRVWVMGFL